MTFTLPSRYGRLATVARVVLSALLTAVTVLLLASFVGRDQQQLANRVDRNAASIAANATVNRAGIDSIICILAIEPDRRTNTNIAACLRRNSFTDDVTLPGQAP